MAHYALLDESNIVTEVFVGKDEDIDGVDWEQYYSDVTSKVCKRTSYNTIFNTHSDGGTAFRGNYAGIGFTYDTDNDVFYPPQPYPSWTISEETNWKWTAPVPYPEDGKIYAWDEETSSWNEASSLE